MSWRCAIGAAYYMVLTTLMVFFWFPFDASALQALLDLWLLPTLIFGFWFAVLEFRKAQEVIDLELRFEIVRPKPDDLVFSRGLLTYKENLVFVYPILTNKSSTVAVWYMLNFSLPVSAQPIAIRKENPYPYWGPLGNADNWRVYPQSDKTLFTFLSNGNIAAYPDYGLVLVTIIRDLDKGNRADLVWDIPYVISSEKSVRKTGIYTLRFPLSNTELLSDLLTTHTYFPSVRVDDDAAG
jgi:hypothetical protein